MQPRKGNAGFSIIELMISLAVLVIIAGMATANWQGTIERHLARQTKQELRTLFQVARHTAINRRQLTTFCPLDAANVCSNDWDQPISVFIDPGSLKVLAQPDYLIRTFKAMPNGTLIASHSGPQERRYFQFNPDGTVHGTIGNLTWCPESLMAERGVHVIVNFGGRIRWAKDRSGDGVVEKASGQPISCA
ncbi:GspH/FimT family pseudopilin [Saccharospirillum alexandrii]|uniref:GspH/FimT family pseudopilin n=1 Tax=Saccharospirillum alexandrii TaxID=2448477 RepID=UPI000FDB1C42|nr:GspH/FimT family pseudopilin [Saccharospirillum alexandrii]